MKHKYITYLLFFFLGLSQIAIAQPPPDEGMGEEAKEKIAALRKAYISDKLDLTEKEAEAFWPIYDQFKSKEKELLKANKPQRKGMKDMTEAEAEEMIEKKFLIDQKRLELKKEYFQKLKTIIPASKIIRLDRAEKGFRTEVMKRMKDRRDQMKDRGRGGNRPDRDGENPKVEDE